MINAEWSSIIVALVVAAGSVIGTLLGSKSGVREANKLVNYRLDNLEAKMDKNNNLVERMAVEEQRSKSAHHRLDDIEKEVEVLRRGK